MQNQLRWVCEGGTEYEITESDERTTRGTTDYYYILTDDSKEFLEEYTGKK